MSDPVAKVVLDLYSDYVNAFNEAVDAHCDKLGDLIDDTPDNDAQGMLMAVQCILRQDVIEARSNFNSGLYELIRNPPTVQNVAQIPAEARGEVDAWIAEMTRTQEGGEN